MMEKIQTDTSRKVVTGHDDADDSVGCIKHYNVAPTWDEQ
jgi:hypothetical protein